MADAYGHRTPEDAPPTESVGPIAGTGENLGGVMSYDQGTSQPRLCGISYFPNPRSDAKQKCTRIAYHPGLHGFSFDPPTEPTATESAEPLKLIVSGPDHYREACRLLHELRTHAPVIAGETSREFAIQLVALHTGLAQVAAVATVEGPKGGDTLGRIAIDEADEWLSATGGSTYYRAPNTDPDLS